MSDEFKNIEEMAELQFSIEDMLIIFEKKKFSTDEMRAYNTGRLKSAAKVRRSLYQSAQDGNVSSQMKMLELINKCDEKNTLHEKPKPAKRPEKYQEAPPIKRRQR